MKWFLPSNIRQIHCYYQSKSFYHMCVCDKVWTGSSQVAQTKEYFHPYNCFQLILTESEYGQDGGRKCFRKSLNLLDEALLLRGHGNFSQKNELRSAVNLWKRAITELSPNLLSLVRIFFSPFQRYVNSPTAVKTYSDF